ncbi:MAG TPA: hypothetical protein VET85_09080 [Stellaceae bacterium]|nr:hypothetical protein [Stellaceae bacterium]
MTARSRSARAAALCVSALLAALPLAASADENSDLDRIPGTLDQGAPEASPGATPGEAAPPSAPAAVRGKYYLEDAPTFTSRRGNLAVPFPPPAPFDWQNRTSLDVTDQWNLTGTLQATFSNRFNLLEESDFDFPSRQMVRNDFREGYVTWEPAAQNYLEAGRINVRNGVALGFNPTDFFKTRTLVDQASLDPSVIREDRLGTFMIRGQRIMDQGSVSISYAPRLYDPSPLTGAPPPGIGPMLDRTNAAQRLLITVNYDLLDASPQALLYHEGDQTKLGLNLSHGIGQSIIAYAEWAGGRQQDLITRAIDYGIETGTIPATAPAVLPVDKSKAFRNDVAIGASWTSTAKLTLNLEYHYHQSGFSHDDWNRWFATGSALRNFAPATGELWFIRGFANDQQEPVSKHQVFLRADWTDAFISNLNLGAFAFVDLYDGSTLAQLSATYFLSDAWTIGSYISGNLGGARTERGSFPQAGSIIAQVVRYF